ncbi:hypothetical protein K466DRAFT_135776 [Polyporus arcularius HHB13444]|uniref:F-box domain-containing protein n=1 Tax=Polyporus arcularius HHB13444 TaxID=1314778 RepID=A0A5C3PF71_9APHY|nr:hypothetical protein K466DRAFT_135776 [Polyporus arcularius HHB13444]
MELHATRQLPPEVAHAICVNTDSLDTLATIVRASRLFHQYACQQIWHTLPSFVPIFLTMPNDAYRRERNARPYSYTTSGIPGMLPASATLKATRPLVPHDLARFALYAPYVRRVVPRHSSYWSWRNSLTAGAAHNEPDMSPELWHMLQAIWPTRLLSLEVLQYRQVAYIGRKAYTHPLHLFAGQSLKTLDFTVLYLNEQTGRPDRRTIDTVPEDPCLDVFVRQLPQLSPHITTFAIATEPRVFARDVISDALCGLSQLTFVKVDRNALRPRAIHHLSTLPALRHLDLWMPSRGELLADPQALWPPRTTAIAPFSALTKLVIHAMQIDECIDLLRHVSSSALLSIVVEVRVSSSTVTFPALASAIAALPSSETSIRSLNFTLRWLEALPPESFAPLLPLSALEELVLSDSAHAAVTDATLRAMAQSWPKMRQLTLYDWIDHHVPQHAIQTTVHGLRFFAQCCPDLERLDVPLSDICAATLRAPLGPPSESESRTYPLLDPSRPHLLERLGVGRPKLHDEAALAGSLSGLFPALMYIEHCWDDVRAFAPGGMWDDDADTEERETLERWSALYDVYQAFVRIRAQERSWRAAQARSLLHEEFRGLGLI